MTRVASYILATYQRPRILAEVLRHIEASEVPTGWALEVCVGVGVKDPGLQVVRSFGRDMDIKWAHGESTAITDQLNAALSLSAGEFVMVTGDDDLQSRGRLAACVAAWDRGECMTGCEQFYFYHRKSGRLARWDGDVMRCGALRSYPGDMLRDLRWPGGMGRNIDKALDERMTDAGLPRTISVLPRSVELSSVCTDGVGNVSRMRPFPDYGKRVRWGSYMVTGVGHSEFMALPGHTQAALTRVSAGEASISVAG